MRYSVAMFCVMFKKRVFFLAYCGTTLAARSALRPPPTSTTYCCPIHSNYQNGYYRWVPLGHVYIKIDVPSGGWRFPNVHDLVRAAASGKFWLLCRYVQTSVAVSRTVCPSRTEGMQSERPSVQSRGSHRAFFVRCSLVLRVGCDFRWTGYGELSITKENIRSK